MECGEVQRLRQNRNIKIHEVGKKKKKEQQTRQKRELVNIVKERNVSVKDGKKKKDGRAAAAVLFRYLYSSSFFVCGSLSVRNIIHHQTYVQQLGLQWWESCNFMQELPLNYIFMYDQERGTVLNDYPMAPRNWTNSSLVKTNTHAQTHVHWITDKILFYKFTVDVQ